MGATDVELSGWWYQALRNIVYTQRSSTTTDVEHIASSSETTNTQKLLRNGQLIILRDGVEYDMLGARISEAL